MADPNTYTVSSDMDARHAGVFRYLGPAGHRFANDHRATSYYLAAILALGFGLLGATLAPTWLTGGLAADTLLRLLCAAAGLWPANLTARAVMRHIDVHRSAAWHLRTALLEVTGPRPATAIRVRTATPDLSQ